MGGTVIVPTAVVVSAAGANPSQFPSERTSRVLVSGASSEMWSDTETTRLFSEPPDSSIIVNEACVDNSVVVPHVPLPLKNDGTSRGESVITSIIRAEARGKGGAYAGMARARA